MKQYNRSIKIALDKSTGEILDADEVFNNTKDAFQIRKKYQTGELPLSCCECQQELVVSGSKYDRLHFKHKPGHSYCILSDERLTPQEHKHFTEILRGKESFRHKELKNKIGQLLKSVEGVDLDSIAIDDKFIMKDDEKRRPDVYCKFQDKEIVFEIQLSDLPLSYILSRYEFYKKHGIYLIWILDNYDVHNQGTLERDIKYLAKHQNFFKLNENSQTFKLECEYKYVLLTENNKLRTRWSKKSVPLNELKYDNQDFQVYYYNFEDNKIKKESLQKIKKKEIEESERKKAEETKLNNAKYKANELIKLIKEYRDRKIQKFDRIVQELEEMDDFEVEVLNKYLKFKERTKNPLIEWIDSATQGDVKFIEFILQSKEIELDINKPDSSGKTPFQAILLNNSIDKNLPIKSLFKAGYKLTDSDNIFLNELLEKQENLSYYVYIYKLCNRLINRTLVDDVFKFDKLLFIIESAKKKQLIYYKFTGNKWISFANNAIQHYSEYWEYLELTFKKFELWNELIELDKKGTFQAKLQGFYSNIPKQKYDFDNVFNDLYFSEIYVK
ncbi:competence protein CoiA [Capnocytophaga catalasegens]|uniref:Competence protein n=1 Tax=Capnocytophaga catalasegens TaxID=1004260 RepID=A0AAV5B1C1_9FLAO|nr:competence protein CoiA [Capnocytophaga catalasegens]GIZ16572.1 hypothetical protein RCZ03_25720 [Capnocytophaga catalasegens]GJM51577.1 hypothetical protein RCZ15_25500 [Capnocytophaga catalasegens]GJM53711.1 hypothetical protein RCZ16_20270 [Capnocytophaga catalasegens]